MILNYAGRRRPARNSGKPTTKDALVFLKNLQIKTVRVTSKSCLVLTPEDEEMTENKEGPTQGEIFSEMAEEIALKTFKLHENLKITGMIYFNLATGEVLQVLEGKPGNLSEALKHVVRDVRQDQLNFQLEKDKVHRRFKNWGMATARNVQEWKLIRLTIPSESDWERLRSKMQDGKIKGNTDKRDSLVDIIEVKRPILEVLGPDCKRIWKRRDAIATSVLSPAEMRFFRQRHEMAKRQISIKEAIKGGGLFSCVDAPENMVIPDHIPGLDGGKSADGKYRSERSRASSVSRSVSRISASRSSIIERLREEENGFVETIDDIADFHDQAKLPPETPTKRYIKNKKNKRRRSMEEIKRAGQRGLSQKKAVWRYIQAIGPDDATVNLNPNQDDFVTSLKFDPSGNCIAIGDSQGRIGIFDASTAWHLPKDPYQFYEEFVSHNPEFDTLYSSRIPRNVIALGWLKRFSQNMHLLAANERTIKLWRLKEIQTDTGQTQICPALARDFERGHQRFFIHSISPFSDGELFLSSDEVALNIWHLERADSCYQLNNTADMSTDTVEINRIITSAKACPVHCYRFFYATSLGEVNLCDLRTGCRQDKPAQTLMCSAEVRDVGGEVLRELECITDADFSQCGNYIVTKQFTGVQIWDLRKTSAPFRKVSTCDTESMFDEMYTSGCLVDDFRVVCNGDASGFVTGTYDNYFMVYDVKNNQKHYLEARHEYDQKGQEMPEMEEYMKKVLHVDWHSHKDVVAAASAHSVYIYKQAHEGDENLDEHEQLNYELNNAEVKQEHLEYHQDDDR